VVNERTVDVHISHLRQKLGDDAREPRRLKTIRGSGYLLVQDPGEHRHHHHRPSATWMLARGLHRRVLGFLFVASCVGAATGVVAHGAFANGSNWHGFLCIGASFFFVFWWLSGPRRSASRGP
jgi:Flp pilus assembly protein TadB